MRLNDERMKTVPTGLGGARRTFAALLCLCLLAVSAIPARAYSTVQFIGIQGQIHNDIATLGALENPTRADRALLRTLQRASNALTKVSFSDGKTLRSLNAILGRKEAYLSQLNDIRANLLTGFNSEYNFVGGLLLELPDTSAAAAVAEQYAKFAPTAAKVNSAATIPPFTARYDAAKAKLDNIFIRANEALIIPFPSDLSSDSVSAKINGVGLRASATSGTDNVFSAVSTETNISVVVSGVTISGGGSRGILFSIPNVQPGAFRYSIPGTASFTNRTGIYPPDTETAEGATDGAIFINTTATEIYGSFSCSGPGFTITDGRFRVTLSQP